MGASNLPIVSLCACRMLGMADVSTATSFRLHIVVANAREVVPLDRCAWLTALAAERRGRTTIRWAVMVEGCSL